MNSPADTSDEKASSAVTRTGARASLGDTLRLGFVAAMVPSFAYVLVESGQFPALAGLYPRFIAVLGLVLATALLWSELRARRRRATDPAGRTHGAEPALKRSEDLRVLRYFGWLLGLAAAFWSIGAVVGSGLFILAFLWVETRTHWLLRMVGPIVMMALLVTFARLMGMVWPTPLVELSLWGG